MKVYLASQSPRRRELLGKMGVPFSVLDAPVEESVPAGTAPRDAVALLARRKCAAGVAAAPEEGLVIGADTLVALEGRALGKPRDEGEAAAMLRALSGRTHHVYTGVAVAARGHLLWGVEDTAVLFRPLTEEEIAAYIQTGDPMDKAGAYGIQGLGRALVQEFYGDYENVVGFPTALVRQLMDRITAPETDVQRYERMLLAVERLEQVYPDAACALEYRGDPWRLLVMGRLSAQCTDARVNIVCKELFTRYPTAADMAVANPEELAELVRPCGLYRRKAADIRACSVLLTQTYGGVLPDDMDTLLTFPGVGRKIANLLLGDIYHRPAVVTDTHCIRICGRLGAYDEKEKNPEKIERILTPLLPPEKSSDFCHRLVWFGRETCTARAPRCAACPLHDLCAHAARETEETP